MFEHEKIVVDASYCPNFGCFASFVPCSVPLVWSNPVSMCLESDVWLSDVGTSVICGFQSDASTPRWSNTKLQEKCTVCVYTYFSKHFSHIPYFTKTENMVYFRAMSKKTYVHFHLVLFSTPLNNSFIGLDHEAPNIRARKSPMFAWWCWVHNPIQISE